MKKFTPLLLIIFFSVNLIAQKTVIKNFKLSNGKSKNVKIHIPFGFEKDTATKYPVTIVLNDNYLFNLAVGNAALFAKEDLAPKQIIVGIPTNTKTNQDVSLIRQSLGFTKNASAFYKFIKNDLKKYLKAKYKTSSFTTIIGDNKSANFAIYFIDEPVPVFNSYICLNPSLNSRTNRLIESYNLSKLGASDNRYFMYFSTSPFKNKKSHESFSNLEKKLTGYNLDNLKLQFDTFEDALNSVSNISEGIPRAYSFVFNLYRSITKKEFKENIKELDALSAIKYLEKKYKDINFLYETNTKVRLRDFFTIEKIVFKENNGEFLRVLGAFADIKRPRSPIGNFYTGQFYEKSKMYQKAKRCYMSGYGKIELSDPNADKFYKNIERINYLIKTQPKPDPNSESKEEDENK